MEKPNSVLRDGTDPVKADQAGAGTELVLQVAAGGGDLISPGSLESWGCCRALFSRIPEVTVCGNG